MSVSTPIGQPPPDSRGRADGVDLDVAGLCRLRLNGASEAAIRSISRNLGAPRVRASGPADLTVRFGAELSAPLTMVGADAGVAWPDGLVLLRGPQRARIRVAVSLRDGPIEVRCEGRDGPIPHLVDLVNLSLLRRGILPLHASAFVSDGRTVLITGWAKGGKTETLAAFTRRGARYVGDEWIYITPDGEVHGLPEPVRLWRWQLVELPDLRRSLPTRSRVRLAGLAGAAAFARGAERLTGDGPFWRRAAGVLREQLWLRFPPEDVFGPRLDRAPPPSHLLLAVGCDDGRYRTHTTTAAAVAERAAVSTAYELGRLVDSYRVYRFGFPGRDDRNPLLEDLEAHLRDLARSRLPADVPATVVSHPPPPFDLARLYATAAPAIATTGRRTGPLSVA